MKTGGRLEAAIEVLAEIETRHRPAADALKDWGSAHRFAGSGDRAAIGNLVYDALRHRASVAWRMGEATPRAVVLGTLAWTWGQGLAGVEAALADPHAPAALSDAERERLANATLDGAPADVRGDYPAWLDTAFERVFGDRAAEEGRALAERAPVDLRCNTLKTNPDKALKGFAEFGAKPGALSPLAIRIPLPGGPGRAPHVESEPAYLKGQVEIQDEGSQLAALVAAAHAGSQVLDLCAGGGGKTLALAAAMANKGQIYAYDADKRRMRDIFERSKRAGAHNIQVRTPGRADVLADLAGRMDLVLVDSPCTGTGTWRRRPDAKWRLTEAQLDARMQEQDAVLDQAAAYVKPGGHLVYVTCSLLAEENEDRVAAFLARVPDFDLIEPLAAMERTDPATAARLAPFVRRGERASPVLRLSPASAGTDGFFVAVLRREAR
ncbi:RsmB/NOP family class I SAM-dependent RNA methyltransferase [Prosthecomicrobium sp. N25]|uniref:RsmB/NOP family class I SAM-dependent RNA methyltransferase n=1 Tax=Prosthecomicrobium sp. N25 TaxID=3129254 RepID=UPI0030769443